MDKDRSNISQRTLRELRKRTVDLRGIADIRLMQVEDGPGRGQRLFIIRNATGLGVEIAIDRGFDICSATLNGINIGWNSANNLPWPPHPVDAEDGIGFYRNLDGFIVTCGLDHFGAAHRSDATHFIHKHRKEVFNPLHGRISSQRAMISGYGIEWEKDIPVIWAEGIVKQSSIFGENLVLRRRVEVEVFDGTIRINDIVENKGFRPTPHAILYHINFGYPFLSEPIKINGDFNPSQMEIFNSENKVPQDSFIDHFKDISMISDTSEVVVELCNDSVGGGIRTMLTFDKNDLPDFGIWRAFQSGVYALALEPMKRASNTNDLLPGECASYWLRLNLTS